MTSAFFADHILGPDTHTNRPAATAVPYGALYECTTHNLIYRNNAGTWGTWATLAVGLTDPTTTKGDIIGRSSSAIVRKAVGADDAVLAADSSQTDGLAWIAAAKVINAQTGTSYTAVLADAYRRAFLTMSNAAASTFTIPPNSSVAFAVGSVIEGAQLGAGQVTLTPGSGVTLNGTPGLKVAAQYGTFGLLKTATDTWLAYGRLSA
jgi:hypothetical protein